MISPRAINSLYLTDGAPDSLPKSEAASGDKWGLFLSASRRGGSSIAAACGVGNVDDALERRTRLFAHNPMRPSMARRSTSDEAQPSGTAVPASLLTRARRMLANPIFQKKKCKRRASFEKRIYFIALLLFLHSRKDEMHQSRARFAKCNKEK